MAKIHVLDQNTINQIAAGEVIERPASIVKELVENAIDAGASRVTVEIRDGGITCIRVTDNGSGITQADVPTAFLPHATSKIQDAKDLDGISSLGFRGEALPSIASIARVELTTKTQDASLAFLYRIEDGVEQEAGSVGAPDGTTVIVRNLFLHVPARRKFLRSPQTEAGHIEELLYHLILSHPDVAFEFINQGVTRLQTSGNHNLVNTITELYGREAAKKLIPISYEECDMELSGFLGLPEIARGTRKFEYYFLNGRYFKDPVIAKAIEEAYRPYLMQHRFPFVVLHLKIDPSEVDVNVHPGKREVRFRNRNAVYRLLENAVGKGLHDGMTIPEVPLSKPEVLEDTKTEPVRWEPSPARSKVKSSDVPEDEEAAKEFFLSEMRRRVTEKYSKNAEKIHTDISSAKEEKPVFLPAKEEQLSFFSEGTPYTPENRKDFRLIGQLFSTYWLIEYQDSLLMIDQHAAHEKVLYERIVKLLHTPPIPSQYLMPPLILTLSLSEQALLQEHAQAFSNIGFEVEHFEGNEYAVRAVPAMLSGLKEKELFQEMLDDLEEGVEKSPEASSIEHRLATMACKAAVKGNNRMRFAEMEKLIDELLTLENPYHCPHGRPTMIIMSRAEIEKKFKRIV